MYVIPEYWIKQRFETFISHTVDSLKAIPLSDGFNEACNSIKGCHGKLVFSGLGKAGIAAKKSAAIFNSLGITSVYLHPSESSHGDSGVIGEDDILMVFSTSGKTREVLETIAIARSLKVDKVIAITSHPDADVRKVSDIVVDMGVVSEAGYLSIAPTTSILVMLTLADMMAVMVAETRGFRMEDYLMRHHNGYLADKAKKEIQDAKNTKI
jgi:arabinose-5-phosphate isomerase